MRPRYADLFRRMRDADPELADAAFDAVLFDREEAVADLVECYDKAKKDAEMRFLCVQLLGFSGSRAGIPTLLAALEDKSPRVRAEACRSLEDVGAPEVTQAVRARLDDMDEDVRLAALEALEQLEGG
jgi:HEAT repeat protein